MYYKIKVSNIPDMKGIVTYLVDEDNFANAAQKVIQEVGVTVDVEEIKWMKKFKPSINTKYSDNNKLYMLKIAEEMNIDDKTKTVKYELPVFANDSNELHKIVNDYITQGLENMRLTTISETKWLYI